MRLGKYSAYNHWLWVGWRIPSMTQRMEVGSVWDIGGLDHPSKIAVDSQLKLRPGTLWKPIPTNSRQSRLIKTPIFWSGCHKQTIFVQAMDVPFFSRSATPRVSPEANSNRAVPVVARWHWQRHLGCAWCAGGEVVLPHHKGYKNIGKLMIHQGYSWSFWSRIPIFFCIFHTHPNFDGGDSSPCLDSQDGEFTIDLQPCTNEMGKIMNNYEKRRFNTLKLMITIH